MRIFAWAALIAGVSAPAVAQDRSATIYAKSQFKGPSITLTGPRTRMTPFNVRSLQIAPGSVWELCSGNTFSGCERFSTSKPAMVHTVRSVRPVAAPIAGDVEIPSQAMVSGSGASLRGLASEFFVVPAQNGTRVEVDSKAAGAETEAATTFCRAHGWRMSAYSRVQSVGGRLFLSDLLCVNDDR